MIEALLLAVRDTIRTSGLGWNETNSEIMGDGPSGAGQPPPDVGKWFCAIHQGPQSQDMMNAKNTYDSFTLTLTARIDGVPIDRIGNVLLAGQVASSQARKLNFNARARWLSDILDMDWYGIGDANNWMRKIEPDAPVIYGYCEPAHFTGMSDVQLVTGDWFYAKPPESGGNFYQGIKADLSFEGARRLQPIARYV